MSRYDSRMLHECADEMLRYADRATTTYALAGALVGLVLGFFAGLQVPDGYHLIVLAIVTLLGLLTGWSQGRMRAIATRGIAQTMLCHAEMEEHTRRAASVVPEQKIGFGTGVRPPRLSPDR